MGERLVYSTKLNLKILRYTARCIVNANGTKFVDFLVDTGAKYTCAGYLSIDSTLKEDDFQDAEFKILGGIVEGYTIKFYKYSIRQFTIGTINLGKRDIWITFDERVSDDVLGMDCLKDVFFLHNPSRQEMSFADSITDIRI